MAGRVPLFLGEPSERS